MKRGILIELPDGDGCEGCPHFANDCPMGWRADWTGKPGPTCMEHQAAYRAEVEAREKAEHDAKQCRFAVVLAQEIIAKAESRAEKAEAETYRACCFIAALCAEAGRGCDGCKERHCPNHGKEVPNG